MNARGINGLMLSWLAALALPSVLCAAEPQLEPEQAPDQELGEVLVEGRKPDETRRKSSTGWPAWWANSPLKGEVDLHAKGRPEDIRAVHGSGNCTGFGLAPAVQCEINVRWSPVRDEDR